MIDGALEPNGMASFRDYITPEQAEGIRAYMNAEAAKGAELEAAPAS